MATEKIVSSKAERGKPATIPTDDDLYWLAAMRDIRTGVIRSAQVAALGVFAWSLIGWTAVTGALMFGAIGWSDGLIGLFVWILPLVWWSLAAIWTLRVFWVRRYRYFANSPDSSRKAVERIGRRRLENLYWATALWAGGNIALICAICYELTRQS